MKIEKRTPEHYLQIYSMSYECAACLTAGYNICVESMFVDELERGGYLGMIFMAFAMGQINEAEKKVLTSEVIVNAYNGTAPLVNQ